MFISSPFAHGEVGRLGPHGMQGSKISNPDHWMAIVGDSGVTGAASSGQIEPTVGNLLGHLYDFLIEARAEGVTTEALTRVPYSKAEFKTAGGGMNRFMLNLGAKLSLKLDAAENSFGYVVGRKLGIKSSDIVLVGQDGVMVETIAAQFGRIYEMQTKTLPPLILLSYTANDLCNEHVIDDPIEEWVARFKTALGKTWEDAKPFLKPHPHGTQIFVLAPLNVVNVITNPEILAQTTNVEGQGEITCGQLRHGETHLTVASWMVMRMLNLMCPSVTQTHPEDQLRLERLKTLQIAFGEAWKAQIEELNTRYSNIHWTYVEDVRDMQFTTGDVANDCFHPSASGHAKIAELILQKQVPE